MTSTPLVGSTFFGIDISQLGGQMLQMRRRVSKRVLLLEFGVEQLLLAEACLTQAGVQLNHISRVVLPPEALERGVPAEPAKMAGLIQEICTEKKIPAHRVAVVLSPEVAFQRLVDLPADLSLEEAREYLLDPANGLQIPFPVTQTDFDLFPVVTPSLVNRATGMQLYMLTAVPHVLMDRVIEMLQVADLELQLLEVASLSQLRSQTANLVTLEPHQVELVLELMPQCSNLLFVTGSGLLGTERLAAIRDFPRPELDEEQTATALGAGLSAESFSVNDESYLPISDLDLRVLLADLKAALRRFGEMFPGVEIRGLTTAGVNSSHPLLNDLLEQALGLTVNASRPLLAPGIAGFAPDEVLIQSGLGRLVGLALGLLPKDSLVSCPLTDLKESPRRELESGVRIEDLLDLEQENHEVAFAPVSSASLALEAEPSGATPRLVEHDDSVVDVPGVPSESQHDSDPAENDEDEVIFAEVLEVLDESQQWPTIGGALAEEEKVEDVREVEELKGGIEEWPTIGGALVEEEKVEDVREVEELKDGIEEWPTIGGALVEEEQGEEVSAVLDVGAPSSLPSVQAQMPEDAADGDSLFIASKQEFDSAEPEFLIPGLPGDQDINHGDNADQSKSPPGELPSVSDSDELGELRFADSDD